VVGQRSRLGTLILDVVHSNEEYGYMAVCFRLKGMRPPASDRSGAKQARAAQNLRLTFSL
jgi:hypothetical protein